MQQIKGTYQGTVQIKKMREGSLSTSNSPNIKTIVQLRRTPKNNVLIGQEVVAVVDTGCITIRIQTNLILDLKERTDVVMFDGRQVKCRGKTNAILELEGQRLSVEALTDDQLISGAKVIFRIDVICQLGGFTVSNDGMKFGAAKCATM